MEYYTQKEPLVLAEYGRYIQNMIQHAVSIADRNERNHAARTIIGVMNQFNPSYKESDELQQKLWDDLFIMSNFELDIDAPYPKPEPKSDVRPEKVGYPEQSFKFKHYGKIIESLIESAIAIENEEERQALTQMIANLMKKSYLAYNRDSVNEEMIVDQLTSMSGGKLSLDADFRFHHTNDILSKFGKENKKQNNVRGGSNGGGKNRKRKWKKQQ